MTRKNYIAIAKILAGHLNYINKETLIVELAALFESDNPNFDFQKFLNACTPEE